MSDQCWTVRAQLRKQDREEIRLSGRHRRYVVVRELTMYNVKVAELARDKVVSKQSVWSRREHYTSCRPPCSRTWRAIQV